ncbi:SGNH/GDSL hydrolase family protein [Mesorhizobium sp. RIZ17]|uniref:SGNH/GDSL hydrolase family protein n=1 Tax=Mesorhizobium sp. RIZ17 TaxID=3132743 RepID=UPI003DAA1216
MSLERKIVACLGSSSTAGKGQAFDWIAELRRRPRNGRFEFRNFGVGGDLAYNALQRLPDVVACRPHKVVVWVGGNDVLAVVSSKARRFFALSKRLPCSPSPDWYRENLVEIARRLKRETEAEVGLCSLCPIGEALDSDDPFQSELNRRVEEYSGIVASVADEERCVYISLYEAIAEAVHASPGRAFTAFRFLPFYRDAFRVLVMRQSPDEVARRNGWLFHTDGVHLNSRAGRIVADCIQKFIDA